MTESYSKFDVIKKFYVSEDGKNGAHLPFNFQMIDTIHADSNATDFVTMVDGWFKVVPEGKVTNWVVSQQLIRLSGLITSDNYLLDWQSRPLASCHALWNRSRRHSEHYYHHAAWNISHLLRGRDWNDGFVCKIQHQPQ